MRKGIFENLGLKLFSLLFALVLWFFVSGQSMTYTEISYKLPLEFKNIPSNLKITNDFQDQIEIRMNGPSALLNSVRKEQLKYTIDLGDITPGESVFSINPSNIPLLRGLKITKISPSKIAIVLEAVIKKVVPIKVSMLGEPPEGYKVIKTVINPSSVELEGAQSEINAIQFLPTVDIDIKGAVSTIQKELDVVFKDISHSVILSKKNISVTIEIAEEILEKEFLDIPVEVKGLEGERYKTTPGKMDILLSGSFLNFKEFKKESIKAHLNVENIAEIPELIKPVVELPLNLTIIKTVPEKFEVVRIIKEEPKMEEPKKEEAKKTEKKKVEQKNVEKKKAEQKKEE